METIDNHPLVVGGIGLIIGGLIASALPVTQVENQVLGATSRQVKDRVGDLASDGVQAVKTSAGEVYEAAASQAKDQGLGADLGSDAVRNLAEEVKAAVGTEGEGDL